VAGTPVADTLFRLPTVIPWVELMLGTTTETEIGTTLTDPGTGTTVIGITVTGTIIGVFPSAFFPIGIRAMVIMITAIRTMGIIRITIRNIRVTMDHAQSAVRFLFKTLWRGVATTMDKLTALLAPKREMRFASFSMITA
jgi:hypothetical protein